MALVIWKDKVIYISLNKFGIKIRYMKNTFSRVYFLCTSCACPAPLVTHPLLLRVALPRLTPSCCHCARAG